MVKPDELNYEYVTVTTDLVMVFTISKSVFTISKPDFDFMELARDKGKPGQAVGNMVIQSFRLVD